MGYKKQSKRKSPFKKYTPHQKANVNFNELEAANVSSNRTGQAVGAIGSTIGDAVEEFKKKKQDKDSAELAPAPVITETTSETFDPNSVEYIDPNDTADEDLNSIPKYVPPSQTTTPSGAPKKQVKTYAQVGKDAYQKAINEGKNPIEAGLAQQQAEGAARNYNKTKYGTDQPTSEGKTNNYITSQTGAGGYIAGTAKSTQGDASDSIAGSLDRGQAPLKRVSPFQRNAALRRSPLFATKGVTQGDLARSSLTNLSYLGDIGKAGAEGYNSQIDRANYKQLVKENQAAELDEEFGQLEVAPTGHGVYDASVEHLSRGWKKDYLAAKKAWKAGGSNEDWINAKHKFMNNAKQYAAGAENLKKNVANYIENKDNISDSTPPEVIDFYDTMDKAADSISVQDIEGVPTFIGQTLGGKPISIPVSDIASGANTMRFNTKVDLQAEFKPTLDAVAKIKTDMETKFGVGTGNLPFDNPAIQQKVDFTLDKLVNNNSKLRAIAADTYGYDHDAFEEATDEPGELDQFKADIKAQMKETFQKSYFPTEKTSKYDAPYGSGSQNLTAGQNLNEQKRQKEQQLIGESIDKGFKNDFNTFYHKDVEKIKPNTSWFNDTKTYDIKLKNGDTKSDLTEDQARQLLTQITGYTEGGQGQGQGRQDVSASDWLKNRNKK